MFRFREVEKHFDAEDRMIKKEEEKKEFLEIKPETNITVDEARTYWDMMFGK